MSVQEPVYAQPIEAYGPDVRGAFMKKVYAHLMLAIAGFMAVEWFLFSEISGYLAYDIANFVIGRSWLLILGGFMVVSWIAHSMGIKARTPGAQYGALALLVVANALLFATPLAYAQAVAVDRGIGDWDIIANAAYLSLFAFAALSAIAIRTGKDFSFLRGILLWGGVLALTTIVAATIFGTGLGTWFTIAMIAFAGAAILYDTQKVYRSYPPGMEIPAAMSLFASLALMFWYVLQLLSRR